LNAKKTIQRNVQISITMEALSLPSIFLWTILNAGMYTAIVTIQQDHLLHRLHRLERGHGLLRMQLDEVKRSVDALEQRPIDVKVHVHDMDALEHRLEHRLEKLENERWVVL